MRIDKSVKFYQTLMTPFILYRNNTNIFVFIWNYDCPEYFNAFNKITRPLHVNGLDLYIWRSKDWVSVGYTGEGFTWYGIRPPDPVEIRTALFAPTHSLLFLVARIEESFLGFWYMPSFALHNQCIPVEQRTMACLTPAPTFRQPTESLQIECDRRFW